MKSPKLVKMADQPEMIPNRVQPNKVCNVFRSSASSEDEFFDCNSTTRSNFSECSSPINSSSNLSSLIAGFSEVKLDDSTETLCNVPEINQQSNLTLVGEGTGLTNQNDISPQGWNEEEKPKAQRNSFIVPGIEIGETEILERESGENEIEAPQYLNKSVLESQPIEEKANAQRDSFIVPGTESAETEILERESGENEIEGPHDINEFVLESQPIEEKPRAQRDSFIVPGTESAETEILERESGENEIEAPQNLNKSISESQPTEEKPRAQRDSFIVPGIESAETEILGRESGENEIEGPHDINESVLESQPSEEKPHSDESTPTIPAQITKITESEMPETTSMSNEEQLIPQMVLNSEDFEFLASRGASNTFQDRRDSLLLRFDPLSSATPKKREIPPIPEDSLFPVKEILQQDIVPTSGSECLNEKTPDRLSTSQDHQTNAVEMSVSLVHDSNAMENEPDAHVNNIKYSDGNIKKKMEEYEATQEILTKRLTEKEKTLSKNCAIIEAYEKALAELVMDKEKLTETYAIRNEKILKERDLHHQHLMSLETTFSDLHKKYENSKEVTSQLQERLQSLNKDKATVDQLLKDQETRYQKMKQHALERLEHANSTLEEQEKSNLREITRLKALLKIEEVNRNTIQEQLLQKTKENEELVKICDELIGEQNS